MRDELVRFQPDPLHPGRKPLQPVRDFELMIRGTQLKHQRPEWKNYQLGLRELWENLASEGKIPYSWLDADDRAYGTLERQPFTGAALPGPFFKKPRGLSLPHYLAADALGVETAEARARAAATLLNPERTRWVVRWVMLDNYTLNTRAAQVSWLAADAGISGLPAEWTELASEYSAASPRRKVKGLRGVYFSTDDSWLVEPPNSIPENSTCDGAYFALTARKLLHQHPLWSALLDVWATGYVPLRIDLGAGLLYLACPDPKWPGTPSSP